MELRRTMRRRISTRARAGRAAAAATALAGLLAAGAAAYAQAAASFPKVSPAEVAAWQERGESFLFVDTRPQQVYDLKHARGAICIPAFAVASKPLPRGARVVLYDAGAGAVEAEQAARVLQGRGHPEFYVMDGGLTAWEAAGLPIVAPPGEAPTPFVEPVAAEDLLRLIEAREKVLILDVRAADVYRQSHVPGAVSAPGAAQVDRAVAALGPSDLIVLYDAAEGDAQAQGERLRRRGFRAVKYLHGGMLSWYEKNLKVER
jgi:rhodanese-related sulfurtransferase